MTSVGTENRKGGSMLPGGAHVLSGARRFLPVTVVCIDSKRQSFITDYEILVKESGTCPASCSFVALGLFFFLFIITKQNFNRITVVVVIMIYGTCQLFVNRIFVTINMMPFNFKLCCATQKYAVSAFWKKEFIVFFLKKLI